MRNNKNAAAELQLFPVCQCVEKNTFVEMIMVACQCLQCILPALVSACNRKKKLQKQELYAYSIMCKNVCQAITFLAQKDYPFNIFHIFTRRSYISPN